METFEGSPLEVKVQGSLEKAIRQLKQRVAKEGILQEIKQRRHYEKPSVRRKRKLREAARRGRRTGR